MSSSSDVRAWKLSLIGVAAGLLGGGLGVGGGIIMVPLLIAAGYDRHRSHATSLAAIVLIALVGASSYGLSGEVALSLGLTVGVGGVVGSVVGASLMHRASPQALAVVFGAVLLAAAVRMITGADPVPGASVLGPVEEVLIGLVIGLFAGLFAGLSGVGGGVIIVPAAVLLIGLSQHAAQGTSLVAIILTALAGTLVNLRNRRVRLRDGLAAGAGGVAGSLAGVQLALAIEGRSLSFGFGMMLLVVAARTLYRVVRPVPPVPPVGPG